LANLIEHPPFTVEPVTEDLETRALQRFWRYHEDKEWSIVDCSSFELMYDRHIFYAFAADHHFKQANRIPLIELHDGSWRKAYQSLRFV
jgi:predicted nucleic acid-binding protein